MVNELSTAVLIAESCQSGELSKWELSGSQLLCTPYISLPYITIQSKPWRFILFLVQHSDSCQMELVKWHFSVYLLIMGYSGFKFLIININSDTAEKKTIEETTQDTNSVLDQVLQELRYLRGKVYFVLNLHHLSFQNSEYTLISTNFLDDNFKNVRYKVYLSSVCTCFFSFIQALSRKYQLVWLWKHFGTPDYLLVIYKSSQKYFIIFN